MKEYTVNSFEEYLKITEPYKGNYFFRGQADKDWTILPSIFRQADLLSNEIENLKMDSYDKGCRPIIKLFEMQHMGKKTRLLDLTVSLYVAAYFAIEDKECERKDGVVYLFSRNTSCNLNEKKVLVIDEFLKGKDLDTIVRDTNLSKSYVEEVLTSEHILRYDYSFSYTNHRAILQGGTAIFCGGSIDDKGVINCSDRFIDRLIDVKIVIPSIVKEDFKKALDRLGYCKDVMYNNHMEIGLDNAEIVDTDIEVHKRIPFYKAIIQYRLSSYKVEADGLVDKINQIYSDIYTQYGKDARVWLYFYYDDYDKSQGNWICRTDWMENGYKIKWGQEYYIKRMTRINEEVSQENVLNKIIPLVEDTRFIHEEIEKIASDEVSIDRIKYELAASEKRCTRNFLKTSDVERSNIHIEAFVEECIQYISSVERMISESKLYHTDVSLDYFLSRMLKECNNRWLNLTPLLLKLK